MFDPPMIDEEEELPDFRRAKPKQRKRPKTNLGPDLRPRLPVFGQPDAILEVTEELRSNDVNHETFVPLGVVNAGNKRVIFVKNRSSTFSVSNIFFALHCRCTTLGSSGRVERAEKFRALSSICSLLETILNRGLTSFLSRDEGPL